MPPIVYYGLLILIAVLCYIIWQIDNDKHKQFIQSHSKTLKELYLLNTKYRFFTPISCDMSHTYDNEKFFQQISCQDYLIYQLQFEQKKITDEIKKAQQNKTLYDAYLNELITLTQIGVYDIPCGKLRKNKLIDIERRLYNRLQLHPHIKFQIKITLYRSNIKGIKYDKKARTFGGEDISQLIKRVNNRSGSFFNDKEIWNAICRVERGKVTNQMRFAIYAKDGYRCRNCGISERYAPLEIDHIIPISKGGKSSYNNLQTLCHKCNVGKGNNIHYR